MKINGQYPDLISILGEKNSTTKSCVWLMMHSGKLERKVGKKDSTE